MISLSSPKEGWSPLFPPDANRFQSGHPSRIATRAASPALSVLNITFVIAFALLFLPGNRIRFWIRIKKESDFVFPSFRARGRVPLSSSIFVADHLRPPAKKAGVQIEDGQRFGLHNLRHSLSNWMVNKVKVEPKTVQGILRHSKIETTLDLYTQEDGDETRAARGRYLRP
jgi:integrase